MPKIISIIASIVLVLHGLIHLLGTAVYMKLTEIQGLPYKTTLLGSRGDLGEGGIRVYGVLWVVPAIGFVAAAAAILAGWNWWQPVLFGVTLFSLILTVKESKLCGAVTIRLYIKKYHNKVIPRNKLHQFLLREGISKPDKKKQKQRKYCKYERKHSFSLVHLDWHESKMVPGKHVCGVEDDASRLILCGGEFDNATGENGIKLMKEAIRLAYEGYSSIILQANTDRGSQFYGNKQTEDGEKGMSEFESFLERKSIEHIPSRRNHPQTNGKKERWFRTYEENRLKFDTFEEFLDWYNDRIHLGLSRIEGITPNEAIMYKLRPESLIGLLFKEVK